MKNTFRSDSFAKLYKNKASERWTHDSGWLLPRPSGWQGAAGGGRGRRVVWDHISGRGYCLYCPSFVLDRRFRNAYHIIKKQLRKANKREPCYVLNQRLRFTQFCVFEFQHRENILALEECSSLHLLDFKAQWKVMIIKFHCILLKTTTKTGA